MAQKCIIVSYSGSLNQTLDTQIARTAKKAKLEWDGTGYDLVKHVREHFVYGSSAFRIKQFKLWIKDLAKLSEIKLNVRIHNAAS